MKTLTFEIAIRASAEKIWQQLWGKESYPQWTKPFCEGTYIEGDIFPGAKVRFMASNGEGMYSQVDQYIENEYVAFRHLGVVIDFHNEPLDEETLKWSGAIESYRLTPRFGYTLLETSVDTTEEMIDHMHQNFPPALEELKRRCEA
ncbi:MAG: hypothetical protein V2I46_12375 [Bacteroides sp.]|jgi:hypothetical protein|nr:hypothetical protein [Bacteroides sp.]